MLECTNDDDLEKISLLEKKLRYKLRESCFIEKDIFVFWKTRVTL